MARTSATHPIRISEIDCGKGKIGLTFCPGKNGPSLYGDDWDRDLDTDLDAIKRWGADAVITLLEPHEFKELKVERLGTAVKQHGMVWYHLAIEDVSIPDHKFEQAWADTTKQLQSILESGRKVLIHCRGGLGRAGLVSGKLLMDCGMPAEKAIVAVRRARPGAIETPEQENYLRGVRAGAQSG